MGSTSPFKLNIPTGELIYTPRNEVINACLNDMIFVDFNKMIREKQQIQVACILEELVHILMNVSDEKLVMTIVASLYSQVRVTNGQYQVV